MKILVATMLLLAAGIAWWLMRDPVEVAYGKCVNAVERKVDESIEPNRESALENAMADAVKGIGSTLGIAACEAMRDTCRSDRDGALCKAALAQFQ